MTKAGWQTLRIAFSKQKSRARSQRKTHEVRQPNRSSDHPIEGLAAILRSERRDLNIRQFPGGLPKKDCLTLVGLQEMDTTFGSEYG